MYITVFSLSMRGRVRNIKKLSLHSLVRICPKFGGDGAKPDLENELFASCTIFIAVNKSETFLNYT